MHTRIPVSTCTYARKHAQKDYPITHTQVHTLCADIPCVCTYLDEGLQAFAVLVVERPPDLNHVHLTP